VERAFGKEEQTGIERGKGRAKEGGGFAGEMAVKKQDEWPLRLK